MRRPLEVIRPEPTDPDDENPRHPLSYLLSLEQIGPRRTQFDLEEFPELPSMRNENWYSDITDVDGVTKVEFRFPLGRAELKKISIDGAVEIVKRFWLRPVLPEENRKYHFDFEVELINRGQHPIDIGYRLDGPTGLPLEGWWYSYKTHPTSFGGVEAHASQAQAVAATGASERVGVSDLAQRVSKLEAEVAELREQLKTSQ